MPKKCIKFIPEYLIPSLNNKRFGERLKWIDKSRNIFEIDWRHKAGPEWSVEEAIVFVEWDKHKGHFKPGIKQYYTQSKQRFRALLYKLTRDGHLIELPSETKFKKVFCIDKKKKNRRKKSNVNDEYESSNEEEIPEELEQEEPDDQYYRKASKNDLVNVLEDHSYTYIVSDRFQNCSSGLLTSDTENEKINLNHSSDSWDFTLSNELLLDNCQKMVLVELNYGNTLLPAATMPNFYTESLPSFECLRGEPENTTLPVSVGKLPIDYNLPVYQNAAFPGNILADLVNNLQDIELWKAEPDQNYEERMENGRQN